MVAGFWLAAAPPAQGATDTLDQSQLNHLSSTSAISTEMLAQTFTAGLTGSMDKISLFIGNNFGGGAIQIQSLAAGKPSGTVLSATAYAGFLPCCAVRDFPLSPAVPVTAGTGYAIVLVPSSTSGTLVWGTSKTVLYTAGQLMNSTQSPVAWSTLPMSAAFETWVVTGAPTQQPPVVAAATNAVAAAEGSLASNTGTYSDPDGDTVTLTASAGTLTKTGTSSGTWSWSQTTADEGTGQTVTITANDGNGGIATTSFTTTITGVAPTAHISGVPANGPEGSSVTVTGSATSPSAADTAAGFTFSWSVTKNGAAYASGSGATWSFTPNDEGTYIIILQATDDGGFSGTTQVTLPGVNQDPTAAITGVGPTGALVILTGESVAFAGHFSDPGTGDSHTVTWTFGDGGSSTASFGPGGSADFTTSHTYTKVGTYAAGLTVVDDDGAKAYAEASVVVETPVQAVADLADYVQDLPDLKRSQKNSLVRKLMSAERWLARGNTAEACEQLDAFIERVNSRHGTSHLSAADAVALTNSARSIEIALGCTSHVDIEG